MAGYATAKREIFVRQGAGCIAVIGVDDAPSRDMAVWLDQQPAKVIRISAADFQMPPAMALPGLHNAQNAFAATEMARALGVTDSAILQGIASFPGLPHRQALIAEVHGVKFINDSKATNADAASRAMGCYEHFIWIAGGVAKSGGIAPLASLFARVKKAFLIGQDAQEFADTLTAHGVANDVAGTLEAAVPLAYQAAREAGVEIVLFSPAAASFDQFKNFEERGDRFANLAKVAA
jgi:UDP-N-acetylmuramoylalanine--D-glutamate ligase